MGKIDLVGTIRRYTPIRWKSPNHIDPTVTLTAFLMSVRVGAACFTHANLLR